MEKKLLYWAAATAVVFSSCQPKGDNLSGNVTGVESDTILVQVAHLTDRQNAYIDTIALQDGKFSMNLPDTAVWRLTFLPKPKIVNGQMPAFRMSANPPIVFVPGDRMTVSGDIYELQPSGTPLYDGLGKLTEVNRMEKELKMLREEIMTIYRSKEKDENKLDSLQKQYTALSKELSAEKVKAVKAAPDSDVSAYLLSNMTTDDVQEAYQALSEKVKNGVFKDWVSMVKSASDKAIAKEKAKENIQAGKPAPDFQLKGIDGETYSLASFAGKYIVLDFWGSWCGWCIKGIPEMKKYYEKYKGKMEIVGIDCNDTEEKWRSAVAQYEMNWTNLVNDKDNDMTVAYAIQGFPTKILIDPQGTIVEVFVGETPEMYKKMDELFK